MEKSNKTKQELLSSIPQVEKLIRDEAILPYIEDIGVSNVTAIVRNSVDACRKSLLSGEELNPDDLRNEIITLCRMKRMEKLQRVINGTGVVIHTNLGRAPLGEEIFDRLKKNLSGYCNLEFNLPEMKRGKRGGFAENLVCQLTGAEDALIVNNNASSVFLILNEFARGRETVVSRGELIQIGGGFRIPDIMNQSGTTLVEVGTTNITTVDDYMNALTDNTSMIFSAHTSNYRIEGFTESPTLKELAGLKNDSVLFVRDLGSGNFISDDRVKQPFEQTVFQELSQGPDLVCFSGDKLLGGCQAGVIVGRKDLIASLRKNPLMRMIRVDKITYAILQDTLLKYVNTKTDEVQLWKTIFQNRNTVGTRISKMMKMIKNDMKKTCLKKIETTATYGGGTMPLSVIESAGVEITIPGMTADKIYRWFIMEEQPVVGTVRDDSFVLDFYTVQDSEIKMLSTIIEKLLIKAEI